MKVSQSWIVFGIYPIFTNSDVPFFLKFPAFLSENFLLLFFKTQFTSIKFS